MYKTLLKRILDFILALLGLIVLSPVFLIISILVATKLCHPVFFTQQRPGQHGKPFNIIKFRTMTNTKDARGNMLPNEQRHTRFGRFLRSTSLDELPELINVLKGKMSIVGPRPLLMQYLPLYNDFQKRRHEVKPGITGWAQVNGRNAISWEEKFEHDVWYVDNMSFMLDLKIIFLTIKSVFKREGINQNGQTTMEPFRGSNPE
jgi:lipopolysaccharide/colanic/teichoic acid biosynthesis glycosyltransferase